jgi:Ser/Thr protein kinase RdoA (MazF antagonist)
MRPEYDLANRAIRGRTVNLAHVADKFQIAGRLVMITPTGNGNVNDTYLAIFRTTFSEERVIIQRINNRVFAHPEWIMENMRVLTEHVHRRLEQEADTSDRVWQLPRVIPTKGGRDCFNDDEGECWRAITLIGSAKCYETAQGAEHAMEVGTVLGQFHRLISDLDPGRLRDTLPGFHVTPLYLQKYDATLSTSAARSRLDDSVEAKRLRKFVEERRDLVPVLQQALEEGRLSTRLIHGDPKVSNIMIDDFTGQGISIVDLDTVKPGLIHYDVGDALRSICNRHGEDAESLGKVVFDVDLCEAFVKGYMGYARDFLTSEDRRCLYDCIRLIAFELGLRFFQDYLAGNVYFKIRYPEQNLNRARVQFRLCESVEARETMIRRVLAAY